MGRGQLVFKGEETKKKKKRSKHTLKAHAKNDNDENDDNTTDATAAMAVASATAVDVAEKSLHKSQKQQYSKDDTVSTLPQLQNGTGTITISGTVVTGCDTRFEREINVGDAIIITPPNSEMRIVTMRLSNISLNLSSPFSNNYPHPIAYQYMSKPRNVTKESNQRQQVALKQADEERRHAFDSYVSTNANSNTATEVVYRERTEHGSYRMKTMAAPTESDLSRSRLLELRAKKTSDKYC